jgi:hypothetical protein
MRVDLHHPRPDRERPRQVAGRRRLTVDANVVRRPTPVPRTPKAVGIEKAQREPVGDPLHPVGLKSEVDLEHAAPLRHLKPER